MKWFVLAVALVAMGCEQTQTVGSCGDAIAQDAGPQFIIGGGSGGAGGQGGMGGQGGAAPLVGDGGPCNSDAECSSAACLPSANSFSVGYCYSSAMAGCIVITDPSPMKPQCASPSKRLYVCGNNEDVSQWGAGCVDVGVGQFGETYQCCNKL